jgi:hypothetical protein
MGKQRSKTSTDSSTSIPEEFKPYYTQIFQQGQAAMSRVPTDPYQGRFVAQADPLQNYSASLRESAANMLPTDMGQGTIRLGMDTAEGKYLNPETNPYLRGAVDAANRDTIEAYQRNLLPSLRSDATGAGAFSNVRRDLAEAQLTADTQRNLLDNASNIYLGNYAQERSNQMMAPSLIQQGVALNQLPGSVYGDIGEYRRQLAQSEIENTLLSREEQIAAPFRGINQMLPVLGLDVGRDAEGFSRTKTSGMFG